MGIYTVRLQSVTGPDVVRLQNVTGPDVVSLSGGSTYAALEVSAGRGPTGKGWTGVSYDTGTGRFTFTSNDGIGYVSDDITVDLDAAVVAAEAARTGAEAAEAATEALFDQFGDQYLGPKASDPTVDNDGDPLTQGDIYFNTTDSVLKFYSGSAWVAPESIATNAAVAAQAAQAAAETAEANAETAEANAETAESNASASESSAASSASAAATSEANAATSEGNAATYASAASSSEANAAASEGAASASEGNAAASASAAATSESNASSSAASASTNATNAATSATSAASSATAAASSATTASAASDAALAALDSFDDLYLGQKASDPAADNDGDPLVAGALYFNTTDSAMKVYEGSTWIAAYASLSGALLASNNLSDLADAAASRANLGLGTAAITASTDYATAAQGALADSAVQPNDTPTFAGINTTGNATFGDNDKAIFGAGSDLQIYAVGGNSFIQDTGSGSLFVTGASGMYLQNGSNETYLDAFSNGAVRLFYDNAEKIATTSTGVDVTGTVTADTATLSGRLTLPTATYHYSSDGKPRLYYYDNGDTLFRTADAFLFRNNTNTTVAQISGTGAIHTLSTVTATSFIGDGSNLTGISAGATGGGTDKIFVENGQTVTTDYTVSATTNAMTTGPIDINSGVTVTVETGGRWVVI